jgi:hypothetical protein
LEEVTLVIVGHAPFRSIGSQYLYTPDFIMKNSASQLKAIGEGKVHWISAHQLKAWRDDPVHLRRLYAQTLMYMHDLGCMYGFITTYNETVLFRQVQDKMVE